MKMIYVALGVLGGLACGYTIGVVRATRKFLREDALRPALISIAMDKARTANDQKKFDQLARLQLKDAIEATASLGHLNWGHVVWESPQDADGYPQFMAIIAKHAANHPELEISAEARTYLLGFRNEEPPRAQEAHQP
jgi:hypothetical protein